MHQICIDRNQHNFDKSIDLSKVAAILFRYKLCDASCLSPPMGMLEQSLFWLQLRNSDKDDNSCTATVQINLKKSDPIL